MGGRIFFSLSLSQTHWLCCQFYLDTCVSSGISGVIKEIDLITFGHERRSCLLSDEASPDQIAAHTHSLSLFLAIKIKNHEPWTAVEEEEVARIFICVLFMKKEFGNVYKDAPVGQGRFVK